MKLQEIIDILNESKKQIILDDFESMVIDFELEDIELKISKDDLIRWVKENI